MKKPVIFVAPLFLIGVSILYLFTAATGIIPGDPTEYTFVAHVLGIAHPPGYALMTLLTKLWQLIIPLGSIAQRSHWLASVAGAVTATLVLNIILQIAKNGQPVPQNRWTEFVLPALFGGLSVAVAADHWQHSIHTNSHIITVMLNTLTVALLLNWSISKDDRWLYAFCLVAGLGPTHHPLTAFSFPAYFIFIIINQPDILNIISSRWWKEKKWKKPVTMILMAMCGLCVWLYYPIRSPMKPVFGPDDMNTLDGFLNVALARGLKVNLFHFGLSQQGQRLLVFWSLLRQQFALPVLGVGLLGLGWLAIQRRRIFWLFSLMLLTNLAFIINTVQDVMAYLLTPFMLIGILGGVGAIALSRWLIGIGAERSSQPSNQRLARVSTSIALWISLLIWPTAGLLRNIQPISLSTYRAGDEYVEAVTERFEGSGENAILLNDWEHITPLWYARYVEDEWPSPDDVTPSMVSTARPWLTRVFDHLPAGPVYLSGYRQEIIDAGFRLRPEGVFYQVLEPGDNRLPDNLRPLEGRPDEQVELLGYRLNSQNLMAGEIIALDLAMRVPITTTDYIIPYAQVGDITYAFTTDGHLLTPLWHAGEVIVERFSLALPLDLPAGHYFLQIGQNNLSKNTTSGPLPVAELIVRENPNSEKNNANDLLANFGQRVGVDYVTVKAQGENRRAVWEESIALKPGESLDVLIRWHCLAPVEESYTVFVHLMDTDNRVWDQVDYTPLGGSYPTHLWFPKWLPGQTALDPYRLTVPTNTPPGEYYVEIGLYGMTTRQRIYQYDSSGNLVGDRLVLGPIQVQ